MPVRWHVGDLKTGRITATLPLTGASWTRTLDDAGVLGGTLQLGDPAQTILRPRALTEPGRTFLAAAWVEPNPDGGFDELGFIDAGPIWTHNYDDASRTLRLGSAGVLSYYDHRKVLPVLAPGESAQGVISSTSGVTLGTVVKKLVALAHTHTDGALPVVLPADVAGTAAVDYPGYELAWVGDAIRALTQREGGPEVQFLPRRSAADSRNLEWVMRVGDDTNPLLAQAGADWVIDHSVPNTRVTGISVDVDGARLGSRAWAPGSGSGESRLCVAVDDPTLTDRSWPLLEVEDTTLGTIEDTTVLTGYATTLARRSRSAPESWTVAVAAGGYPKPHQVNPGDWATVIVGDHPYLDPGAYRGRITQITGNDAGDLTLAFQREID